MMTRATWILIRHRENSIDSAVRLFLILAPSGRIFTISSGFKSRRSALLQTDRQQAADGKLPD
jgi:hypothetical protein